jgi:hypothetical protein
VTNVLGARSARRCVFCEARNMPDHPKESTSARYRSLAGECWEIAHTFPAGERRTLLLQMAQVWQRLAQEQAGHATPNPAEGVSGATNRD